MFYFPAPEGLQSWQIWPHNSEKQTACWACEIYHCTEKHNNDGACDHCCIDWACTCELANKIHACLGPTTISDITDKTWEYNLIIGQGNRNSPSH